MKNVLPCACEDNSCYHVVCNLTRSIHLLQNEVVVLKNGSLQREALSEDECSPFKCRHCDSINAEKGMQEVICDLTHRILVLENKLKIKGV